MEKYECVITSEPGDTRLLKKNVLKCQTHYVINEFIEFYQSQLIDLLLQSWALVLHSDALVLLFYLIDRDLGFIKVCMT